MKEQQEQIESLNLRVSQLSNQILYTNSFPPNILYQNVPNPVRSSTNIKYTLPANTADANILIFDIQGRLVKKILITERGDGNVNTEK